jgi:hypothetical protein
MPSITNVRSQNLHAKQGPGRDTRRSRISLILTWKSAFPRIRVWDTQVDTVAQVGEEYLAPPAGGYPEGGHGTLVKPMLKWLDNNIELCKMYGKEPQDVLYENYWRTIVGNVGSNHKDFPCDSKQEENFRAFRNVVNGLIRGRLRRTGRWQPISPIIWIGSGEEGDFSSLSTADSDSGPTMSPQAMSFVLYILDLVYLCFARNQTEKLMSSRRRPILMD